MSQTITKSYANFLNYRYKRFEARVGHTRYPYLYTLIALNVEKCFNVTTWNWWQKLIWGLFLKSIHIFRPRQTYMQTFKRCVQTCRKVSIRKDPRVKRWQNNTLSATHHGCSAPCLSSKRRGTIKAWHDNNHMQVAQQMNKTNMNKTKLITQ